MIESGKSSVSLETLSKICTKAPVFRLAGYLPTNRKTRYSEKGRLSIRSRALFRKSVIPGLADEAEQVQVFDEEILTLLAYSYIGIAAELLVQV